MAALGDIAYRGVTVWKRLVGNTTTTRKFLRQVGDAVDSAAPAWDQVTDADLSTSDVTTNNVSITKHGFTPKAPNDTTKFLRGDATWAVPTGGGGSLRSLGITIDGGGSVITTGVKGFVSCPFSGTITKARVLSTDASVTSGSIVVDVWKDTYANYPPTNADSITASAPPTISSAVKSEDATLTGWTTSVTSGDVFGFNVDSVTSLTRVVVELTIQE